MYEKKGRYIVEFQDIPKARQHQIEIDVDERRGSYKEVELGFDEQRALQEARRCLSCRRCLGCALCWAECKPEAIDFEMEDEILELEADELIISPGVERPLGRVEPRFGLGTALNVITDLQLERMLSETGPSAGLVLRPYDGEMPAAIAFVQSYPAAAPEMQRAALNFALNEAIQVRRRLPDAVIEVFAGDLAGYRQEQADALSKLDRIDFQEHVVGAVAANGDQSLQLTLGENGSGEAKNFGLVVLITQPQIAADVKHLTKALGLSMSYAEFLAGGGTGLIATEQEAVKLAAQP